MYLVSVSLGKGLHSYSVSLWQQSAGRALGSTELKHLCGERMKKLCQIGVLNFCYDPLTNKLILQCFVCCSFMASHCWPVPSRE